MYAVTAIYVIVAIFSSALSEVDESWCLCISVPGLNVCWGSTKAVLWSKYSNKIAVAKKTERVGKMNLSITELNIHILFNLFSVFFQLHVHILINLLRAHLLNKDFIHSFQSVFSSVLSLHLILFLLLYLYPSSRLMLNLCTHLISHLFNWALLLSLLLAHSNAPYSIQFSHVYFS